MRQSPTATPVMFLLAFDAIKERKSFFGLTAAVRPTIITRRHCGLLHRRKVISKNYKTPRMAGAEETTATSHDNIMRALVA